MIRFSIAAAAALVLMAAGDAPPGAAVNIDNFTFGPAEITVAPGTRVTWTNRDDIPHTVVDASDPRAMKSPVLDSGDHFDHVFATAGIYRYFCSIHPHMQGTIIVR